MISSILDSTKKLLGIDANYTVFDEDILVGINSALMTCMQLGVGPSTGFTVTDSSQTWEDFLPDDMIQLQAVKQYVYMKTRMIFDPPDSSAVASALSDSIKETEWRLNVQAKEG